MKLTAFFLFIICMQVAARTEGQTVSLKVKNASMKEVFREIQKQTGLDILVDDALLEKAGKVTLDVKDMPVSDVLNICLKNGPLDYTIVDERIVVKLKPTAAFQPADNALTPAPPPVDITGRITNEHGEPMAGASVVIKRTGKGDIADANGNFKLKNVNSDDIITISFAGYKTESIKVGNITAFTIVMEVATNNLDKVVIQAYGTTTDRARTGNIATVTAAEIERQPVMNPLAALVGKVPGLVITQTNGYASAPFKVEIRGRSVIDPSRPSEPLYIIDGVPLTILENPNGGGNYYSGSVGFTQNGLPGPAGGQSPFFSINPNDIETITVLKDADATAIYGSRGANGVILITTKKGKAGKTKFDLNAYQGVSEVTQHYSMLNTNQYLEMRHEAFQNDRKTPTAGNAYDLLTWDTTRYTDWQKYLWGGRGKTTDVEASLSGGDKLTTFRIGSAYHRETDLTTISGANERASVQFNLSHKSIDQKLNISFTSTYSYTKSGLISLPGNVAITPDAPAPFDEHGNLNWSGWLPRPNPFGVLLQKYTSKTGFLNTQLTTQYEFLKGFNFLVRLGYSTTHNSQSFLQPIASQNPLLNPTGIANFGSNNNSNAIVEPELEYLKPIAKGKLDALIGASMQSVLQDGNNIFGSGYVNDNLLSSISNAPTRYATDANGEFKYGAFFARVNYNWRDKYIFNFSARRDGSSRFGPGKQYGNFGAVGLAYIFTEENWFKQHLAFLSFGKLRGSYGTTGSDNIGEYNYLTQWSAFQTPYLPGMPSYLPLLHANPDLQWQVDKKLEAALHLGVLKDRITVEVAWYRNRCGNQLVSIPLPIITGFDYVTANLNATIQNTGIESSITAKLIDKTAMSWSVNFDIGSNRNKLIAFPGLEQGPYASIFVVGQSLNIKKLLHYTGIDPQTGLYTFEDRNHDGQINTNSNDNANDFFNKDLSIKFDGGFGTDLSYKGLQLSISFHFRSQNVPANIAFMGIPGGRNNYSTDVLNRWQKPGDKAQFARFTTSPKISDNNFYQYADALYSNGSYVRLQNVSLSYDIPAVWTRKLGIQGCKFYLRGQNLFLITKYNGIDPDVPVFGGMPPAKIFTGGVLFNF